MYSPSKVPALKERIQVSDKVPALRERIQFSDLLSRFGILIVWLVIIAVFSILQPDTFFTGSNFASIFGSQAVLLMLTIGTLFSLTVGEFDLSVAGALGLSYVLIGWLNVVQGWPIVPAIVVAIGSGVLVGFVNAFFVVRLGVPSIIVTLGSGTLLVGLASAINDKVVSGVSDALVTITRYNLVGLPVAFWGALALTLAVWYVYRYTPLGRYLYFVGAGREVSRLAGLRVNALRAGGLVATSTVSAAAGVVLAGSLGSVDPNIANSYLLPAYAAAFLGSTAFTPGRFNPLGSFIAVYFLITGITGLEILGYSGWIADVFYGGSLVIAVTLSKLVSLRKR
ncbi:ABC transporter permease [Arthrobacter sp. MI7-26]|uniref:ABC transporter permease n=1 Tax=Arthrobacter sp. MI7-26 TaxID=2993653 RepID=UPI002249650B|nr:ABC transporter permease [Arthrobacter sp. MI7-26]MCX2749991.1 ABC transporter permease [Arthrobacter sp. MI7-26]